MNLFFCIYNLILLIEKIRQQQREKLDIHSRCNLCVCHLHNNHIYLNDVKNNNKKTAQKKKIIMRFVPMFVCLFFLHT